MAESDDIVKSAREQYERARDAENHNRRTALEDIKFARLPDQWPENVRAQRTREGRPCLTINKLPVFIRQVVNDSRQNKPSIKVRPADSRADPETADVIGGLIRNIEYISNADVAYDTAIECAVTGGFGYWRVVTDYAYDDAFEMDLLIKRVANPFSVYGDPNSTEADSSDWDVAFVVDRLSKAQFERQYGKKAKVSWNDDAWDGLIGSDWRDDERVMIAEWWTREEIERPIVLLQDGTVLAKEALESDPDLQVLLQAGALQINGERVAKSHKVRQRIMSGLEELEASDWPGRYIPIVPVYGDEFDIEGRRYFRSLIHSALDAQRMFNYWRTASTELVALAPKVPFIGPKGAFDSDIDRWNTANTRSHPFLEYDWKNGMPAPPQRQPLDMGVAAGALQEALNASDDMKSIIGLYDASLGARSNETSGRAIMARQREGDVATFHFIDNLARAIRHTGRILIDLIPKIYDKPRIVRVLGEDKSEQATPVNQQFAAKDPKTGQPMQQPVMGPDGQPQVGPDGNAIMQPIMRMHDLAAGKYDLTVTTGPSFTTRREEAAMQMTELLRAFPPAAPVIGPELAKNLDWPGADEIAKKMEAMASGQLPPQIQKEIEQGKQQIAQLAEENQKIKTDSSIEIAKLQAQQQLKIMEIQGQAEIARMKVDSDERVAAYKAEIQARAEAARPQVVNSRS
jgi:hypothetical protein